MNRRKLFKTLFGAVAAVVAAPLIPIAKPIVANDPMRVLIPLLRRTMPTLITSELISVQPMSGPSCQVFAMKIERHL